MTTRFPPAAELPSVTDAGRVRMCGMTGFTSETDLAEGGVPSEPMGPEEIKAALNQAVTSGQIIMRDLRDRIRVLEDKLRRIGAIVGEG